MSPSSSERPGVTDRARFGILTTFAVAAVLLTVRWCWLVTVKVVRATARFFLLFLATVHLRDSQPLSDRDAGMLKDALQKRLPNVTAPRVGIGDLDDLRSLSHVLGMSPRPLVWASPSECLESFNQIPAIGGLR